MHGLRYEPSFEEARKAVEPDAQRFDDQFRAIEWQIRINAESGAEIPGTRLRAVKTRNPLGSVTPIIVYYEIVDENTCALHYIERVVEEEDT
jgi:hypothetical protein